MTGADGDRHTARHEDGEVMNDRMHWLSHQRWLLQRHGLTTPEAVRSAAPEQLARWIPAHDLDPLLRLVEQVHPDVMAVLFCPAAVFDWRVSFHSPGYAQRMLTMQYEVGSASERRVWLVLKTAIAELSRQGRRDPPSGVPAPDEARVADPRGDRR